VRREVRSVTFDGSPRSPPEVVNSSVFESAIRKAASVPIAARPSAFGVARPTSWGRQVPPPSVVRRRYPLVSSPKRDSVRKPRRSLLKDIPVASSEPTPDMSAQRRPPVRVLNT
jgi:hypothetical protein